MTGDDVAALRADLAQSLTGGRWGEAAAVVVLLGFEPVAGQPRFARHTDRMGIDWHAMLAEDWSLGERFLIATAAGLWSAHPHGADVCRVPSLDDEFYRVWLAMVTAARTGRVQ